MQEIQLQKIFQSISHDRLSKYKDDPDDPTLKLSYYLWNMALSESLYPTIQCLEVALRNSLFDNIQQLTGVQNWFDSPDLLADNELKIISRAKTNLTRDRKPLEPNRIIAELNFGFWTSLFNKRYEQKLWPKIIKSTFPFMPKKHRTRKTLSERFNKVRKLRNRIFHHEPIWHWRDLKIQHQQIIDAIGWINPELKSVIVLIDRFPKTFNEGPLLIQEQLKNTN